MSQHHTHQCRLSAEHVLVRFPSLLHQCCDMHSVTCLKGIDKEIINIQMSRSLSDSTIPNSRGQLRDST